MRRNLNIFIITMFLAVSVFAAKKIYNHVINQSICNQCGDCVKGCEENAIKVIKTKDGKVRHEIDPALCTQCGVCIDHCKLDAIEANEVKADKK